MKYLIQESVRALNQINFLKSLFIAHWTNYCFFKPPVPKLYLKCNIWYVIPAVESQLE